MNILYYQHQFPAIGGIEAVTATLSNYFASQGHEITIVSHIDKGLLGTGISLDTRVVVLHMPDAQDVTRRNRDFLQQVILERKIDIVIFQDSYAAIERNLFPAGEMVKVITVEHSAPCFVPEFLRHYSFVRRTLWHFRHPFWKWRRTAYERNRRRFLYDQSDRYVLLSNQFYGEFRAITGLTDTRKLRAIPNPFASYLKMTQREKRNEIVFCATLTELKGCDMLLRVWGQVQSRCPDWQLTIVGNGPDRAMLERMKDDLKLERCSFVGYKQNPAEYFARAKIFAFPSRREGWGLVLVEAMANGCVPVAFDSYGAIHDIVKDGECGVLVPAFDVGRFGDAIVRLAQHGEARLTMAEAGVRSADAFAVPRVADQWMRHLREIVVMERCMAS